VSLIKTTYFIRNYVLGERHIFMKNAKTSIEEKIEIFHNKLPLLQTKFPLRGGSKRELIFRGAG